MMWARNVEAECSCTFWTTVCLMRILAWCGVFFVLISFALTPTYLAFLVTFSRYCLDQISLAADDIGPIQYDNSLYPPFPGS